MAAPGMQLRSGTIVGHLPGAPSDEFRPLFEEGVSIILQTWTGLALAVSNEWGGPSSQRKADQLRSDIIEWFYRGKEHWADELEDAIDGVMKGDFNVELEDGSQAEVSKALVQLHAELMVGNTAMHTRLKETQDRLVREGKAGGAGSKRQVVDNDGAVMEGEGTSDSGSDEDMDEDGGESEKEPRGPIIDDDGFELVQRKGRRR